MSTWSAEEIAGLIADARKWPREFEGATMNGLADVVEEDEQRIATLTEQLHAAEALNPSIEVGSPDGSQAYDIPLTEYLEALLESQTFRATEAEAKVAFLSDQLQAAQVTIAEAREIAQKIGTEDDYAGGLPDLYNVLSCTDTSAYDTAILTARRKELRDAADLIYEEWPGGTGHEGLGVEYAENWLRDRAASIEQTEAE